jgi:hypothetical protein
MALALANPLNPCTRAAVCALKSRQDAAATYVVSVGIVDLHEDGDR